MAKTRSPLMPSPPTGFLPRSALELILHYMRRRWTHYVVLFGTVIGAAACAVLVQYAMKVLVDALDASQSAAIWNAVALFLSLIAAESVLWRVSGWIGSKAIVQTGVDIRLDLFQHLAVQPMNYFSQHLSGALSGRVTAVAGNFAGLTSTLAWQILPVCIDFCGAVILFFTVDWRMGCVVAFFVALVAGAMTTIGIRGRRLHASYAEQASQVGGELVDTIANMWVVKAFSTRVQERRRLAEKLSVEAHAQSRSWLYLEKMRILHDAALWIVGGGMLVWVVWRAAAGAITTGDVVMISALTFRVLHGSRELGLSLTSATQQTSVIDEALATIGVSPSLTDAPDAFALEVGPGGVEIDIRNLHFAYPNRPKIFSGFDLHIPAGQNVGIVGRSGAGKSTLLSLIQRFDDPQAGEVRINGQAIAAVTQDSLRALIAVVPQEIGLFHRSILENIRIGRPEASDEEVIAAAIAAHCDEFVRALPEGYATKVGERGVRLSGGQRQRLGIARAILKNAPLVILDEATSALDGESERAIQQALVPLAAGRTLLAVAHRLSTLERCDRILVLQDGKIVQDGPPTELRKVEGPFRAMWHPQSGSLLALDRAAIDKPG